MAPATLCTVSPAAKPQALAVAEPFALGAHLVTPRRGYTHHGIYAGNGRVVHYAGWSRAAWACRPVEEVALEDFANGRAVGAVNNSRAHFSPEQVVARARSRLGEDSYRITTNNCEHFCDWCRTGEGRSPQVDQLLGWLHALRNALLPTLRGTAPAAARRLS